MKKAQNKLFFVPFFFFTLLKLIVLTFHEKPFLHTKWILVYRLFGISTSLKWEAWLIFLSDTFSTKFCTKNCLFWNPFHMYMLVNIISYSPLYSRQSLKSTIMDPPWLAVIIGYAVNTVELYHEAEFKIS